MGRHQGGVLTCCRLPVAVCALVLSGLGFFPRVAIGQYRPPAPLPQQPTPTPSPSPTGEGKAETRQTLAPVRRVGWTWEPGLVLDGGWEQNIGFTRPSGPDDIFGALTASLARVRRGERSEFRLAASGVGYLYREVENRNRVDGFLTFAAQGPLSRRVDGRLSGSYSYAHTDSEGSLISSGVILPLARTQTSGGETGLTWRAAERTSLSLGGTWYYTQFETGPYLDTTDWIATFNLSQRVSSRDDLTLSGSYEATQDDLSTRRNPAYYAGYGHRFGSSMRLELSAGVARQENFSTEGGPAFEPRWGFYGTASLSGRVRRSSLSARYRRGPQAQIGMGTSEVTDAFTLGLRHPLGRWIELVGNGAVALRAAAVEVGAARRLDWDLYFGAFSRLSSQLRLGVGYRFRRRDDPLGTIRNDRATVSLVWGDRER